MDFGCGTGVWTKILKDCLPSWEIWGTDLSETAVKKARIHCTDCSFFPLDEAYDFKEKFNFIFTHHVLEHVFNIYESISLINSLNSRREKSYMFHIFPCGNPDSYEYKLCSLIQNGIEKEYGNRFFFEDEGHVRRMTTQEITSIISSFGFNLTQDYYANQYHGAVRWITDAGLMFINSLCNVDQALHNEAKTELIRQRRKLLILSLFGGSLSGRLQYVNLPSKVIIQKYLLKKAINEWNASCTEKNGSEMYLLYERTGSNSGYS